MIDFIKYLKKKNMSEEQQLPLDDPMRPKHKIIWIDTETTGTTEKHGVIQFTAKVVVNNTALDSIDMKIQPFKEDLISDEALEVNKITREELFSSERFTPQQAYKAIIGICQKHIDKFDKKDKFIWKGFNSRFDMDMTRALFTKCGDKYFGSWFWFPPADIMGLAMHLLQRERGKLIDFKQRTVWEYLHPDLKDKYKEEEWHDALFDVDRCMDIETALRSRIEKGIHKWKSEAEKYKVCYESQIDEIKRLNQKLNEAEAKLTDQHLQRQ